MVFFNEIDKMSIDELEVESRKIAINKRKLKFKEGMKKAVALGTTLAIFATPITVVSVLLTKYNRNPFKRDDIKHPKHIRLEFNEDGKEEMTSQYEPYEEEVSSLNYYYDWEKEKSQYSRTIDTYNIEGLTYEEISDSFTEDGKPNEELLGKPVSSRTIYIGEEPSKDTRKYDGVIYTIDQSDYVTTKQDMSTQVSELFVATLVPGVVGIVLGVFGGVRVSEKIKVDSTTHEYRMAEAKYDYCMARKKELIMKLKKNSD